MCFLIFHKLITVYRVYEGRDRDDPNRPNNQGTVRQKYIRPKNAVQVDRQVPDSP